ncbi:MAG: hypothetical protein K0R00_3282 [Herbinix sp.]|jgi:hypothetical protein|nr:hypothetical protein [Herbinix sp.]
MIKKHLMKAVLLGLFISTLYTGSAYAMATSLPAGVEIQEVTPELQALYDKQAEIDAILFKTNASDLEAKDIFVNYTGVTGDYIEIGIATYSDEKADFIYELVGKDQVKVVEFDDSIMYASGLPTVEGSGEDGSTGAADPLVDPIPYGDGIANSGIAPDETTSDGNEEKVYKGSEEDGVMTITSDNAEINESDVVKTTSADSKDADAMSTPMMILIVAGAAVVIGGAVTVANKNKNKK